MYGKVSALMQWRSDLLFAGRYEDLAQEYRLPLVLYLKERPMVIHDTDQLVAVMAQLQASRRQRGIASVRSEVTAMDLPRNGRFRVWVRHHEIDVKGRVVTQSDSVQYCCETVQGIKGVMVEFGRCSIPEIWETQTPRLATQG